MSTKDNSLKAKEKSCLHGIGFIASGSSDTNTSFIDVNNGKIVRIRPLHFDWKYVRQQLKPRKMKAHGKSFEPTFKSLVPPYSLSYKKRVYSPNRILYPLKRMDWNPKGERNPQNRGSSKYVRISWEEALDIVAKAELLNTDTKTAPRTYYIGIPKRFVAGAVYDFEADECLEGVTVTLKDLKTGEECTTMTDNFGDLWFEVS